MNTFNEHVHSVSKRPQLPAKAPYLLVTALFAAAVGLSGVASLAQLDPIPATFARLGLPLSLAVALGACKLAGAIALFVPGRPRLREWAYAGLTFDLAGAVLLHLAAGDGLAETQAPALLTVLGLVSYALYRRSDAASLPLAAAGAHA
ncbi:MAG: DoxX family protein [Myxococcales bacterium]|nr:DoxX family protein [Myxococcales bacterium]